MVLVERLGFVLEEGDGFLITLRFHEMAKPGRVGVAELLLHGEDGFGNGFQGFQMRSRIRIPPSVIGDDVRPLLQG